MNERRIALLRQNSMTAPTEERVLVIDEHGDRKWGSKTAHNGKQYLANLGKIDTGVVSVTSLWAEVLRQVRAWPEPWIMLRRY